MGGMDKMYKTKCAKCGRTYQTEIEWYSYICDDCKRKKEEYDSKQQERDKANLDRCKQILDETIASGDKDAIALAEAAWDRVYSYYIQKYGNG